MTLPLLYDVTRLSTRFLTPTPNGIDRVDFAYADRFLTGAGGAATGLFTTPIGARAASPAMARDLLDALRDNWGEDGRSNQDPDDIRILAEIAGHDGGGRLTVKRRASRRIAPVARLIGNHGVSLGRSPADALPEGGIYLNVSQFPLWIDRSFAWLSAAPKIRGVFFLHDMLPLTMPEYFRPREQRIHRARLRTLARHADALIVSTDVVAADARAHLAGLGRADLPIHVAHLPVADVFREAEPTAIEGDGRPYFVVCGTIEPRKNHLLLLHVWRDLVARLGSDAPKLVIVGRRGWENENILDLLDRCPGIAAHVVEVGGLSTPHLRRLMRGARALLMPSFGEGFGLPVAEGVAAGVPVICSDIATFHEIGGPAVEFVDPIDGAGWRRAILDYAAPNSPRRAAALAALAGATPLSWATYFAGVEDFLDHLMHDGRGHAAR